MAHKCQAIVKIDEEQLVTIFDIMIQLFENQIEQHIEKNFTMKEMQAYYKIRTKTLNVQISELKRLIDTQNDDIKMSRSQYTDELTNIREEVGDLRQMHS